MRQLKSHCFGGCYFQSWRINRLWTWVTLAVVAVPSACEDPCDHGWFYVSYGGFAKCYYISNSQRDFGNAREYCIRYNASLASIATEAESNALADLFRSNQDDERFLDNNYWISMSRADRTQPWQWLDGSEVKWENWDDGEPEQHDVCARAVYPGNLQWRGGACSNRLGRICEKAPNNATPTLTTSVSTQTPTTTTVTTTAKASTTESSTTTTRKTTQTTTTLGTTTKIPHTTPLASTRESTTATVRPPSQEDEESKHTEGDMTREVLVAIIGAGWVCAAILGSILIYCIVLYVRDNRRRLTGDSATKVRKTSTVTTETTAAYENCL